MHDLRALSDEELLSGLDSLLAFQRQTLARLLAYLGEVEERELHLLAAYPSLYAFCLGRLRMSEDEACRRIAAARLARRFPAVLQHVESSALHLSALGELGPYLTEDNHEELLRAASGKTKRQVQALLAERFPKPDVPSAIRRLAEQAALIAVAPSNAQASQSETSPPPSPPAPARAASRVEPLSAARYEVRFTASEELRQKLELCKDRLSHVNPSGDLAVVLERAVDLLLAELEKTRLGKTERPRRVPPPADPGTVTRAARREVFERDGERCAYVDEETGRRCEARALLQIDHQEPRALGGRGQVDNLRLLCAPHNRLVAKQRLGRERVQRAISERRRESALKKSSAAPSTSEASERSASEASERKRIEGAEGRSPRARSEGAEGRSPRPSHSARATLERAELHDKLSSGLTRLGFKSKEAKQALAQVFAQRDAALSLPPIEELMREALWLLAPG
jgi:hypothetical protein